MKQTEYDLVKMRHARAVASIRQYASCADRETAMGGWIFDWGRAMREAHVEAIECEEAIAAIDKRKK